RHGEHPRFHGAERGLRQGARGAREYRAQPADVHRQFRHTVGHRTRHRRGAHRTRVRHCERSQACLRDRAGGGHVGVPVVRVGLAASRNVDADCRHRVSTDGTNDDLDALLRAAGERVAAGDRKGAIPAYRKAISLAPQRAELHHDLGALLARAHRDGEALRAFAAAARQRPEWPEPWLAQGDLLFARGRYVESAGAFEAAAARAPTRIDAWLKAAKALTRTKHWSRAMPHLARARELAPTNEDIWGELQTLLLRSGREEDADADFLRFETVAMPSARTIVAALRIAMRRGD